MRISEPREKVENSDNYRSFEGDNPEVKCAEVVSNADSQEDQDEEVCQEVLSKTLVSAETVSPEVFVPVTCQHFAYNGDEYNGNCFFSSKQLLIVMKSFFLSVGFANIRTFNSAFKLLCLN